MGALLYTSELKTWNHNLQTSLFPYKLPDGLSYFTFKKHAALPILSPIPLLYFGVRVVFPPSLLSMVGIQ